MKVLGEFIVEHDTQPWDIIAMINDILYKGDSSIEDVSEDGDDCMKYRVVQY